MDMKQIGLIGAIVVIWVLLLIFGARLLKQRGKATQGVRHRKKADNIFFRKSYDKLSRNFLTQGYLAYIYRKLANLSIYRRSELKLLSAQYFFISVGGAGALMLAGVVLFSDVLATLICVMFGVLFATILVDKQLDKTYAKVLFALSKFLGSMRQEYLRTENIVDSLAEADCMDIIKRPVDEIYSILTVANGDLKLQEFYESTPFRTLQSFAAVSYNINNQGDDRDSTGQSNFVQALTLLSGDINAELQKIKMTKQKFGNIEYLPFVPILGMPIIQSYFGNMMPGTSIVYGGPLGYIFRIATMLSCILSYVIISRINSFVPIKEDDRGSLVVNLLENRGIRKRILAIVPKGGKSVKVKRVLKAALSKMDLEQLYLKKVIMSMALFCISILTLVLAVNLGKEFLINNTQQLSLIKSSEMDDYSKKQILHLDNKYLANYKNLDEKAVKNMISEGMPGLSDLQIVEQVKRLEDKKKSIDGAYFRWWYVWLAFGAGVLGWLGPNLMLKLRLMLVKNEAEDDFLQLQTLVGVFMNTNLDTLDILYQLAQNSRMHKDMLLYCYHSYPSNPELELARLQSKTSLPEFKRFVSKLKLTINDLAMKEAFSDLAIERDHIVKIRTMTIESTLAKKRSLCSPISMLPLAMMILGSLLIPLGILGFSEFKNALSMMGA